MLCSHFCRADLVTLVLVNFSTASCLFCVSGNFFLIPSVWYGCLRKEKPWASRVPAAGVDDFVDYESSIHRH